MKLYELFNRVEVSISRDEFLLKAKLIYRNLTDVEKVMVDREIIINNNYPSYYWKLIAAIYFMILGKDMEPINDISFDDIKEVENKTFKTRIRSKSESEIDVSPFLISGITTRDIKSIYDYYLNFKLGYKPFKNNSIDKTIKKLKYDCSKLFSIRDKMILVISNAAKLSKLQKQENKLVAYPQFINCINFISFYESLTNFKCDKKIGITWFDKNYDFLFQKSKIFANEFHKCNYNRGLAINKVLEVKYGRKGIENSTTSKAYNLIKMIISGDYIINISDLYFIFDLCKYFFDENCEIYISNVLFVCKNQNVSLGVIMLYDSLLMTEYINIELTLEYIVSKLSIEFADVYITKFELNSSNLESVLTNCRNFQMFEIVYKKALELDIPICIDHILGFIIKSILRKEKNSDSMINLIPSLNDELPKFKEKIVAAYIEICDFEFIKAIFNYFPDIDVNIDIISIACGRSCSIDMYELLYNSKFVPELVIKNIIIGSLKVGSEIFFNMFTSIAETLEITDIILAISESFNTNIMCKYKDQLTYYIIDLCLDKTIVLDNIIMFSYLWSLNDHTFTDFKKLIITCCKYNRNFYLDKLLKVRKFELKFYIHIFDYCSKNSNILIINKILIEIGNILDISLTFVQLTKLEKGIRNILESGDYLKIQWLKENLVINPLFNIIKLTMYEKKNKRRTIIHKYSEDSYISSDEDDINEIEDYFEDLKGLRVFSDRSASF